MSITLRNLQVIKARDRELGEALEDLQKGLNTVSQAVVVDPSGALATPPPINSLNVTGQDGIFHALITDNNAIYRPINYFLEYSQDAGFNNSHTISLGPSRSHRISIGNQSLHWRGYSQYVLGGPPSKPVNQGTGLNATPVTAAYSNANLAISGPSIPISTGSGTNTAPSGGVGGGKVPFTKTSNGLPPKLG